MTGRAAGPDRDTARVELYWIPLGAGTGGALVRWSACVTDTWNSNSLVSWVLVAAGVPTGGRHG